MTSTRRDRNFFPNIFYIFWFGREEQSPISNKTSPASKIPPFIQILTGESVGEGTISLESAGRNRRGGLQGGSSSNISLPTGKLLHVKNIYFKQISKEQSMMAKHAAPKNTYTKFKVIPNHWRVGLPDSHSPGLRGINGKHAPSKFIWRKEAFIMLVVFLLMSGYLAHRHYVCYRNVYQHHSHPIKDYKVNLS